MQEDKEDTRRKHFISFLGTGNYREVYYRSPNSDFVPDSPDVFIQVARVRDLIRRDETPDVITILMTPTSRETHWDTLQKQLLNLGLNGDALRHIEIPVGRTEEEQFEQLQTILESVDEGDILYVDMTHGFRSMPILFSIASQYLEKSKSVSLREITYGAFELKEDNDENPAIAPTFDLSPMLSLNQWAEAWSRFDRSADLSHLAVLLKLADDQLATRLRKDRPRAIYRAQKSVHGLDQSMSLIRPAGVSELLANSLEDLRDAELEMAKHSETRLAAPFVGRLRKTLSTWSLGSASNEELAEVAAQLNYADWLLDRNRLQASSVILRELLIDLLEFELGSLAKVDFEPSERTDIDRVLGFLIVRQNPKATPLLEASPTDSEAISRVIKIVTSDPDILEDFGRIGVLLIAIRNSMSHANRGEHDTSSSVAKQVKTLRVVSQRIRKLMAAISS